MEEGVDGHVDDGVDDPAEDGLEGHVQVSLGRDLEDGLWDHWGGNFSGHRDKRLRSEFVSVFGAWRERVFFRIGTFHISSFVRVGFTFTSVNISGKEERVN